ncbi:MAG: hypothetical protein ACQESK_09010 [Bacteroidota bacterium]
MGWDKDKSKWSPLMMAVYVGISLGGGISWPSPFDGAYIIGVSITFGVGVSPTIISAGAYGGYMEFYSKN